MNIYCMLHSTKKWRVKNLKWKIRDIDAKMGRIFKSNVAKVDILHSTANQSLRLVESSNHR